MLLKSLTILSLLAFCAAKYEITTISEYTTSLGGSPFWDEKEQCLYFVDIFALKYNILRFDWNEQKMYRANIPNWMPLKVVDFIIPYEGNVKDDKNNTFIIGDRTRISKDILWDGKSEEAEVSNASVFSVEQEFKYTLNFWHIATTDPTGRFYGGTLRSQFCNDLPTPNAALYMNDDVDGIKKILDGFKVTGGMDWDRRNNKFGIVDVCNNTIYIFDWDPKTGAITNRREVFKTHEDGSNAPHHPVSLVFDREGMIYVSMFNDSSIWKIDPNTKKLLEIIEMPTELIVNLAFGGPNLDKLLVTSASVPLNANIGLPNVFRKLSPQAGSLFIVHLNGSQGYAHERLTRH